MLRGGYGAPAIADEEEAIFGEADPSPEERKEVRRGLRHFLLQGQPQWRLDGGVRVVEPKPDPRVTPLLRMMQRSLKRRPSAIIGRDQDCRDFVGTYWELDDFHDALPRIRELLEECRRLEQAQIEHVRAHGTHVGDTISASGCRALGMTEEKIRELVEGVRFEVDANLQPYSRGPYPNVYQDLEIVEMACREFNVLVRWLIPTSRIPFVENRATIVTKDAPLEASGKKNRTCVDLTDSGVNDAVELWEMDMPSVLTVIRKLGPGSFVCKQDLKDCFYHWKVHPSLWTFFGVRHPLTGQSFVLPVLPMGFRLSPPICCANTQLLADIITLEMDARWEDRPSPTAVLAAIPRQNAVREGARPSSTVYVDDFMNGAPGAWIEELITVAERVFEVAGVTEKKLKREGPDQLPTLLGFVLDTLIHRLSIPPTKAKEILKVLESMLRRAGAKQSVSHQELSSLVGKLTWAAVAVVLGRAYLRHIRKPLYAVQDLLRRRRDRECFCIPIYHFGKLLDELRWWREALKVNGGSQRLFVDESGHYDIWTWLAKWGDVIPAYILQFASDASKWGGGYLFESERRVRVWTEKEKREHINVLECLMVLQALQENCKTWSGRRVLGWCDNSSTVRAVTTGRSRSNLLMGLVRRIRLLCVEHDIHLHLLHIPGVYNVEADQLSRGVLSARVSNWSLIPQCMQRWDRMVGGFTLDVFADPSGANSVAERYRSSVSSWAPGEAKGQTIWAFPPPVLVEDFLREVEEWEAERVVALIPSRAVPMEGWSTLHRYAAGARIFTRPVALDRVRCAGSGVEWSVIEWRGSRLGRITGPEATSAKSLGHESA